MFYPFDVILLFPLHKARHFECAITCSSLPRRRVHAPMISRVFSMRLSAFTFVRCHSCTVHKRPAPDEASFRLRYYPALIKPFESLTPIIQRNEWIVHFAIGFGPSCVEIHVGRLFECNGLCCCFAVWFSTSGSLSKLKKSKEYY